MDLAEVRRDGLFQKSPGRISRSRQELGLGFVSEAFYSLVGEGMETLGLALAHDDLQTDRSLIYVVTLERTPCHFGGGRWWFRCPLAVDGVPCLRRCRILYRPLGKTYFGCRECHRLTYESRQRHRDRLYDGWAKPLAALENVQRHRRVRSPRRLRAHLRRLERAELALRNFASGNLTTPIPL